MSRQRFPFYLGNEAVRDGATLPVADKYSGSTAFEVTQADIRAVQAAIKAADAARTPCRRVPAYQRQAVLDHVVRRATEQREALAEVLCIEAGKPIRDARGEVDRFIDTFRFASGESVRMTGEYLPLDINRRAEGCEGFWRRVPVGPCGFITPFNFPLNLVAHKVAPAIAAGCPFVLKPASSTPVSALMLGEILAETDLPLGAFSILPCDHAVADSMITDERIKLISFTGSPDVGWGIKARAGKKKVLLELGGNAACILDEDADLDRAADRIIIGAFYQSGQSCISVQRILAHAKIYEGLRRRLVERASALKAGDPRDETTFLGPLITERDAIRVEQWVADAVAGGAKILCGGKRRGSFYDATLLENVNPRMKVCCSEVFGPVATLQSFEQFRDAVAMADDSDFGLQSGVFTQRIDHAMYAFNELEVGGVIINDVPSFRVDHMPYGGVKHSGLGREGIRYAMEEMTELRLMVLSNIGRA